MANDEIYALSPLDGRYARETQALRDYFSEFALVRARVRVEIDYLIALSRDAHLVRPLTDSEVSHLQSLVATCSLDDARAVKEIERTTRHDVKALENFLRARFASTSLADIIEWLHFALTSEDVTLAAQALALRDSRDQVILPALDQVLARLTALARQYQFTPMLARTHGQPAVPTTLGKEFAVFLARLKQQRALVSAHRFEAKITGAVGNFNASVAAAPQVDWLAFSAAFIRAYDLEPNLVTTQLTPFDNWLRYFDALRLTNSILIDFAQDIWRYISDDYLKSRAVAGEVGSSTMPQKVNPIDFENAEGNFGLANALFEHLSAKLPISRLQRDLTDSTVSRNIGVPVSHTLIAIKSLIKGLDKLILNEEKIKADLENNWAVVSEAIQTILRREGFPKPYETLKELTRTNTHIDHKAISTFIEKLNVPAKLKEELNKITPANYTGRFEI